MNAGALTPADAFTIDQKVDDGGYDGNGDAIGGTTGAVRAFDPSGSTTNCVDVSTGFYNISNTQPSCMLGFGSDQQLGAMTYFGTLAVSGNSSGAVGGTVDQGLISTLAGLGFAGPVTCSSPGQTVVNCCNTGNCSPSPAFGPNQPLEGG